MANRRLTALELAKANKLLDSIRSRLATLSTGNRELLFAYRRKVYKELTYDERSKPMVRRALKMKKWMLQKGKCAVCGKQLPEKYTVLDRIKAVDGYSEANTRLVHAECDVKTQAARGYA